MPLVTVRTQPVYGMPGTPGPRLVAATRALAGLIAYWRLNNLTTTILDSGPLGLHGTAGSNVTLGQGALVPGDPSAGSCGFPGNSGGAILVPHTAALNLGNTFTIMALISPASDPGATSQGILSKGSGTYYVRLKTGIYVNIVQSETAELGNASRIIAPGDVRHIAWTKSGTTNRIYIDGLNATGSITNATFADNTQDLYLGNDTSGSTEFLSGRMAEVVVCSVAQAAATIRQIALLALGGA